MKKRTKPHFEPLADGGFDVSSLVDICFLLLMYFLVTSVILPQERDLDVASPGSERSTVDFDIDPLLVTIEETGMICCGEGATREVLDTDAGVRELPLLLEQLAFYRSGLEAAGEEPLVVIQADDAVSHQRVVDVLNALTQAGIEKVSFRDPEGGR